MHTLAASLPLQVRGVQRLLTHRLAGDDVLQRVRLQQVLENPNNFLSTIQVGITLINILSGASLASGTCCECWSLVLDAGNVGGKRGYCDAWRMDCHSFS